jgi:hypothetical protein
MFQFSIRFLLLLTTVVAVIVWVLFAPPHVVGALVMVGVCLLIPPVVVGGVLYQRDYWRAFFIGAAPWALVLLFGLGVLSIDVLQDGDWLDLFVMNTNDSIEVKFQTGPPLAIILCSGLAAVALRWWSLRKPPAADSPRS